MNGEKSSTNSETGSTNANYDKWQKMADEVRSSNSEQKQEVQVADDSELVQEMVDLDDDIQEELEYYVEKLELQDGDLFDYQLEDLSKILNLEYKHDKSEPTIETVKDEIARRQELVKILTDALGEQSTGSKELQGKPIEEILQAKIDGITNQMGKIYDENTGYVSEPEQIEKLAARMDRLVQARAWIESFRERKNSL